jgi:aminopeptidase N
VRRAWRNALSLALALGAAVAGGACADPTRAPADGADRSADRAHAFAGAPLHYALSVQVDPSAHQLRGHAAIQAAPAVSVTLTLNRRFAVQSFTVDGRTAPAPRIEGGVSEWALGTARTARRIEISWHGDLDTLDSALSARQAMVQSSAVSSPEGSFLPAADHWYPLPQGLLHSYAVTLELPAGQRGLVPGDLVSETDSPAGYSAHFAFNAPAQGIDLMAGPYRIDERMLAAADGRTLRLRTWFHPAIADLAPGYLDAAGGFIQRYERSIGRYPFATFSIVSSVTPTGFGMPSLTYLGIDVLRLPFIRRTSLGHEVLHNWWGNGVYADDASGNWAEGLTTFMADYAYREEAGEGEARSARLEWLRDFAVMPSGEDLALAQFVSRDHDSAQIVGYGKAAMVFLMLRDLIGRAAFDAGLRSLWAEYRFRSASWDDVRKAFEAASGQALAEFFAQWVQRTGAPRVRIACAQADRTAASARLMLTLSQDAPAYRLQVPVSVDTSAGRVPLLLDLQRTAQTFSLELPGPAQAVELDPEWRLFRRLDAREVPPILRRVMIDPATRVVLAAGSAGDAAAVREAGLAVARALIESPQIDDAAVPQAGAALVLVGLWEDVQRWLASHGLPGAPAVVRGRGDAAAWSAPLPGGGELVGVAALSAGALRLTARPLPHYGRRSYVVFDSGKQIDSGLTEMPPQRSVPGERECARTAERP